MSQSGGIGNVMERLSLYDLWNYFFTGAILFILVDRYTNFGTSKTDSIWFDILLCAFLGMLLNRLGSTIERACCRILKKDWNGKSVNKEKRDKEARWTTYKDYIDTSKSDGLIETFWDRCSLFRSCAVMLFVYVVICVVDVSCPCIRRRNCISEKVLYVEIFFSLLTVCLLIFSYISGEETLRRRINCQKQEKEEEA